MLSDIIAAISTPIGKGGVAVIRVSGAGSVELVSRIFFPASRKSLLEYPARFSVFGEIRDEKGVVDTALTTYFKAPASFTGEDVVEISCHGGYIVSGMVLETVLSAGARLAEAGEFTRRAYINNKISLSEAEAIGDILSAVSREGVRLSSSQASGVLSSEMKDITDSLTSMISSLYAFIDYPDEDLEDMSDGDLISGIDTLLKKCRKLLSTYRTGSAVIHGIPTLIVGKTNVGKSSLFNTLIGERKAIVTDIAGTTRDMLEYSADVNGLVLRLIDTAGLRENTTDAIEEMGMDIAREKLHSPETSLILALFDLSRTFDEDDKRLVDDLLKVQDKEVIPVFTKSDLACVFDKSLVEKHFGVGFEVSSNLLLGIVELKDYIFKAFVGDSFPSQNDAYLTNIRQKSVVEKGIDALNRARTELVGGMKDMTGMVLEEALCALLEVDARSAGEQIVNEIFSKFCVGK